MADKSVSLQVKVNTDTGQLEVLGAKFADVGRKATEAQTSFSKLGSEAGSLLKQFIPLATAGGIVAFFTNAVRSAEDFNQTVLRLKGNLAAAGINFEANKKQIFEWSEAVQAATRFDNDVALASLEKFARATKDLTSAMRLSQLAMDLAVRSGKPLEDTQRMLMALAVGQTRAVQELTREFGAMTGGARNAQEVLDNLQRAVAGAAAEEQSLTKDVSQAKAAFGDFSKEIGQVFGPFVAFATRQLTNLLKVIESVGAALGAMTAGFVSAASNVSNVLSAMISLNPNRIRAAVAGAMQAMKADVSNELDAITEVWKAKSAEQTQAALQASNGRIVLPQREADEEVRAREEANQKIKDLSDQLDVQMAQIGQRTLQQRLQVIAAEYQAEKNKITRIQGDEVAKASLIKKLGDVHVARVKQETEAERKIKTQAAFDIAATTIEALSTINSMGELRTREDARRAKLLLALEKSIAIARLWSAEAGKGVVGLGIAAAGTALIVAQFAAQSQAIDRARQASEQGAVNFTASTPLPGGGSLDQTFGGASPTGSGAVVGGTSSGFSAPSAGGGGSGGSIQVVNVGGIVINFSTEHVDLSEVNTIARRLADAARSGVIDGIRLAVTLNNVATKNAGLAV